MITFSQVATSLMDEQENPAVVQAILRHARMDMTLYYSHSSKKAKRAAVENYAQRIDRSRCGYRCGYRKRSSETEVDGELVYDDELTARKWALNSAVECHLPTSSLCNTFQPINEADGDCQVPDRTHTRPNLSGC